jgi:hypothetical protein
MYYKLPIPSTSLQNNTTYLPKQIFIIKFVKKSKSRNSHNSPSHCSWTFLQLHGTVHIWHIFIHVIPHLIVNLLKNKKLKFCSYCHIPVASSTTTIIWIPQNYDWKNNWNSCICKNDFNYITWVSIHFLPKKLVSLAQTQPKITHSMYHCSKAWVPPYNFIPPPFLPL